MTGRDKISAGGEGFFEEKFEFYFFVTHNVRIRGSTGFKLFQHIFNDFFFIIFFEVKNFKVDSELCRDAFCVGKVFCPGAFHAGEVARPVFHIDANDFIARVF